VPWFFLLPSGIVVLFAIHRLLAKPVDEPAPAKQPDPKMPAI
jgi:hypothetical protein